LQNGSLRRWGILFALALVFACLASTAFAQEAAPAPESKGGESYLMWIIKTSGFIGAVILLLSLYFVATVARLFMEMRQQVAAPPELIEQCETLIQEKDFRRMYQVVKESDTFLGRILAVGLAEMPQGISEARDAMDRSAEAVTIDMEKQISMLAVLGTLGPMIGLLGTLKGMISSFSVIATSGAEMKASEVAGGISEALLLTFEGVALSVPAIYFYAVFRNRVATISATTTFEAEQLLRRMYNALRTKNPPANPPAAVR
jgi:biopolymer transport protein ExbB